jgi:EAL domain-containing protein (putative c-di-GMP-specific phosphodiesterase class I)
LSSIFSRKESADAQIIRAVIALARGMDIALVAEGIETDMQRDFLQREGCKIGQGYLFSKPLSADDFKRLLS